MALSSSARLLRRALRSSPSLFPVQSQATTLSTSPTRFSSSTLFGDDDAATKNPPPPLTTPKLFVSGLSRLTTDGKLHDVFAQFGQLVEAKVITDRVSGRSKGFGFVTYATIEEAEKAREGMNAKFLDGWVIFVDPAKPRERKPPAQPEPVSSETGFKVNKTIGWCG
ncbi:LOW QUALITY PROTEIN: organelle RRM domain-containing protein 2, mitochondrial [Dioscorea cayenensis subsp. rotundata]|uniref:LOW QUALITY PROTEIN: organelle RRM domain-containing protein 2, mitochondrial n=1 Tax=Dioscorea cayennensis subsp. rotundata TaxID=55577 RepID=A0AB40BMA9_DIOCR|nr:LOW QUALITY PROTEIN: organelle RRM domain-containing protein 2, mitochondrial [Dioscorea cayenensis subsp. rotundata]